VTFSSGAGAREGSVGAMQAVKELLFFALRGRELKLGRDLACMFAQWRKLCFEDARVVLIDLRSLDQFLVQQMLVLVVTLV